MGEKRGGGVKYKKRIMTFGKDGISDENSGYRRVKGGMRERKIETE